MYEPMRSAEREDQPIGHNELQRAEIMAQEWLITQP